jgi:hypothetical protein
VEALFALCVHHYYNTQVNLIQTSSTYQVYSQILLADHLICTPGNACLLPSLLSEGQSILPIGEYDKKLQHQLPADLINDSKIIFVSDYQINQ